MSYLFAVELRMATENAYSGRTKRGSVQVTQVRRALDVFFRGERNYIQGSLILHLAAQELVTQSGCDSDALRLQEAKFVTLMDHAIDISVAETPDPQATGSLKFSLGDRTLFVSIHPAERPRPPRRPDRPALISAFQETGRLSGEGRYEELANFDDAIAALVELNKALHARLDSRVTDIWFAGIRNADLAVTRSPFGPCGRIAVECSMERPWQERTLTLSRVKVLPDGHNQLAFEILFSYRLGR